MAGWGIACDGCCGARRTVHARWVRDDGNVGRALGRLSGRKRCRGIPLISLDPTLSRRIPPNPGESRMNLRRRGIPLSSRGVLSACPPPRVVMPRLVRGIHVLPSCRLTWMRGSSPRMTVRGRAWLPELAGYPERVRACPRMTGWGIACDGCCGARRILHVRWVRDDGNAGRALGRLSGRKRCRGIPLISLNPTLIPANPAQSQRIPHDINESRYPAFVAGRSFGLSAPSCRHAPTCSGHPRACPTHGGPG